jgi:hypothetical protein
MRYLITILFLITLFAFLIFYNLKYIPLRDAFFRLRDENKMWQEEVSELKERIQEETPKKRFSFSWDELFPKEEIFSLKEEGKELLFSLIQEALKDTGCVYVYNYGPSSLSKALAKSYPTELDFTWAKGRAIVNYLILTGIPRERINLVLCPGKILPDGQRLERVCEITF